MSIIIPKPESAQYPMYQEIKKIIQYWDVQIAQNPQEANSFLERGKLWLILKNYENALADFNQTLFLDFDNEEAEEYKKVVLEHLQTDDLLIESVEKLKKATMFGIIGHLIIIITNLVGWIGFYLALIISKNMNFYFICSLVFFIGLSASLLIYAKILGNRNYKLLTNYALNRESINHIKVVINDYLRLYNKVNTLVRIILFGSICGLLFAYIYLMFFNRV